MCTSSLFSSRWCVRWVFFHISFSIFLGNKHQTWKFNDGALPEENFPIVNSQNLCGWRESLGTVFGCGDPTPVDNICLEKSEWNQTKLNLKK